MQSLCKVKVSFVGMKRFAIVFISIFVISLSYAVGQIQKEITSEDSIKSFIVRMYDEKLYEDYDFLQEHCSPELLKKLQEAYEYDADGVAYATWLFRSGRHDEKPGSDGATMVVDVKEEGDRYVYTALDMGWEFARMIKAGISEGRIIIEDIGINADSKNDSQIPIVR